MKILTAENKSYELDSVPDQIDDIRYCVLDTSDPDYIDYFWLPLIFLESFHAPAICLTIGDYKINMPLDWSVMICDDDLTAVEVIPLASLSNRGFRALAYNPMFSSKIIGMEIQITNIFQDVIWYFPKLKNGNILAVPLESGDNPKCAYFVKEANKVNDLTISDLIG